MPNSRNSLLICLLSLLPGLSNSQACLPSQNSLTASPLFVYEDIRLGACVRWVCYLDDFTDEYPSARQLNTYCGNVAEIAKVSSRLSTIVKAADPLKSLQTMGTRFTVSPLSDPQFLDLRSMLPAK